jgi:hypothetical protein
MFGSKRPRLSLNRERSKVLMYTSPASQTHGLRAVVVQRHTDVDQYLPI